MATKLVMRNPARRGVSVRLKPLALSVALSGVWTVAAAQVQPAGGLQLQTVPALADFTLPQGQGVPLFANGDKAMGQTEHDADLRGHAEMRRFRSVVKGDHLHYDQDTDEIQGNGHVRLVDNGNIFVGPKASLFVNAGNGFMLTPSYHLGATDGNGKAERIDLIDRTQIVATRGTYTGCGCSDDPAWYLKYKELDLDTDAHEGTAYNGVLFFQNVPIFASPYLSFPLNNERKSGFLPPTFGLTSTTGFEYTQPYYFNIAPNRDLTIAPRFMAKRGVLWNGDFRYLEPTYAGVFHFEYLPDDRVTGENRYLFTFKHNQKLPFGVNLYVDYTKVSDDNYPDDFGSSTSFQTQTQRLYNREYGATWSKGDWSFLARVQRFQTLAPSTPPYERVPQLNAMYRNYDWHGFDIGLEADYSRFRIPVPSAAQPNGERLFIKPFISYPIQTAGYFVIPKVTFNATSYHIENLDNSQPNTINRALPTISLDTGLNFERKVNWFGSSMIQTLEPRLFYVYTPFRNQNAIPLFDTAQADFNLAEIFGENTFIGNDRIADANRVTAGITSRFIDAQTGVERARFWIAQRYNFTPSKVTLNASTPPDDSTFSDLLVGAQTQLGYGVSLTSAVQYSPSVSNFQRADIGLTWRPGGRRVFNAFYHYLPNPPAPSIPGEAITPINQVELSGQWPFSNRVNVVGRVNYAMNEHQVIDALAGLEYDADCWSVRVALQRYATNIDTYSTRFFAQLELRGLSKLGTSVTDTFRTAVPGYEPAPPTPVPSRFSNYE